MRGLPPWTCLAEGKFVALSLGEGYGSGYQGLGNTEREGLRTRCRRNGASRLAAHLAHLPGIATAPPAPSFKTRVLWRQ